MTDSLEKTFSGAENFLNLLLRQSVRNSQVVIRYYGQGTWHQFSGNDFAAHLGRAAANWLKELPGCEKKTDDTLLFICGSSYGALVASLGATLVGLNTLFLPPHIDVALMEWCAKEFNVTAIATDIEEMTSDLASLGKPVFNIGKTMWLPQDKHAAPEAFALFREFRTAPDARVANAAATKFALERVGSFQFISFGHDGSHRPETLRPDAIFLAAHNLLLQIGAPASISWKSMELLQPWSAFTHVGRLAILLKNGVLGFTNPHADWETNLRILRPTVLFGSSKETAQVVQFAEEVAKRSRFRSRYALGDSIEKANALLGSVRVGRVPENVFNAAKRALRVASRVAVGGDFVKEAVEDLSFIVHGLSPAFEPHVSLLERLNVPVVETYGTTSGAGVLSANTYSAPYFNLIGTPLAHVSFRLGSNSTLEYRLNSSLFGDVDAWHETGDVVQMTAHGFSIAGRAKHLFVTAGGITISPVRLERLLRETSFIADVCIVGDRMPYLAALVVLTPEAATDYRVDSTKIQEQVAEAVARVNETLPRNVTIKKFQILDKPFQENLGEKLASGDINRIKIIQSRSTDIQNLYQ